MASPGDKLIQEYFDLINDALDYTERGYRRRRERVVISRQEVSVQSVRPADVKSKSDTLGSIAEEIAVCNKCALHNGRQNTVPGEGVINPLVMCIGEAPGADEDRTGRPFVGKAGQYLDKWLEAIGLFREKNCFIGNIIKCRPPKNRDPGPEEVKACLPYLFRQLEIIRPRMILSLGRISSQILAGSEKGIGALRGGNYSFNDISCVPTYHPSAVLRNQEYRKPVWDDLRRLKSLLPDE